MQQKPAPSNVQQGWPQPGKDEPCLAYKNINLIMHVHVDRDLLNAHLRI